MSQIRQHENKYHPRDKGGQRLEKPRWRRRCNIAFEIIDQAIVDIADVFAALGGYCLGLIIKLRKYFRPSLYSSESEVSGIELGNDKEEHKGVQ